MALPDDPNIELEKGQRATLPVNTPDPGPSLSDTFGAAFKSQNTVGSLYDYLNHPAPNPTSVPGFDPATSIPKGYEGNAEQFVNAHSPQDMEVVRQSIDRQRQAQQVISQSGLWGTAAEMAAGAIDPVTIASMFIPVGGEVRLARIAQNALIGGATSALQEGALQMTQPGRTTEESVDNIASTAILSGVLGGVIRGHVKPEEFHGIADAVHSDLHEGTEGALGPIDGVQRIIPETEVKAEAAHPESLTAQEGRVEKSTAAEGAVKEQVAAERSGIVAEAESADRVKAHDLAVEKAGENPQELLKLVSDVEKKDELGKQLSPAAPEEPMMADIPQAIGDREAANDSELHINPGTESTTGAAAVTPTMRGDSIARGAGVLSNTIGRVSPGARLMNSTSLVARQIIQHLANIPELLTKNFSGQATISPIERNLWKLEGVHWQGRQARNEAFRTYRERIKGEGGEALSRKEFDQEISKSMRRGDQHPIPEVAKAARDTRKLVFDPLKSRAIKLGLLPEDVKADGADSYLMRQYDVQKIRGNLSNWLDTLTRGFTDQGTDIAEARDIAHKVTRNILGSERGTMDWHALDDIVPKSGQLKERTLKLPDSVLEPYLNNDINRLSHSYLRSMGPEVEMTERFGSRDMEPRADGGAPEGDTDHAPNLKDLRDDYARMIERAPDDAAKEKLMSQMDADLRDLNAVRDRLYGIYGAPKDPGHFAVRAGRLLRSVNALRLLGAATLAHFPDVANVMMRYGMGNTFSAVGKMLAAPGVFKMSVNVAKRMGAALDMSGNMTASILGDYAQHSQYIEQRIANGLTSTFTMLTGETPFITGIQSLTSVLAQDSLIRTAQKVVAGKNVDGNLLARMAAAGIDRDMLGRIAEQHEQFGAKVRGLNFGMSEKWTDQAAAQAYESAILRDAHSVTLRPGVGDTPLFMSTEWGKALRQFTTFGYAAQRGVVNPLMQGLAHGDPRAMSAMFALCAMGTLSYVSKQTAAGQPIEPYDSPKFALEVLDKSNLLGWTSDVVFPALWMMGMNNLSRWSDRDPVETIGGPVVGTVFSTYAKQLPAKFINSGENSFSDPDEPQKGVSRSDVHFMRRLMPGQNLWWARSHINDLEDVVGDAFDLPGKSNADRAAESSQIGF